MRRISKRTWLLIVVGTIIALLVLLIDLLKGALAPSLSHLPLWIIAVGIVALVPLSIAFGLWQEKLKSTPEALVATARENRQRMLKLVQNKWITDFLENPLYYSYDEQLLPLPLRENVGSRFDLVLSNPLEPTQTISPSTTITQVFDRAQGELLILGEPGAGKTTLLLQLTRDLLKRVKDDEEGSIPVVLMLASLATEKLPLEQWIVKELRKRYDVPSRIGEAWVKANQLLLLLDGLDEVAPSALPACIEAINEYYHQTHRSLVVCCRMEEFLKQAGRLALHTAVIVQPLSSEQVDAYLDGLLAKGEDVEGLKHALYQSAALCAFATTPLFLTVLILAYHGKPVQEILALVKATPSDQQHLIFHDYVERMLQREGTRIHGSAQQTKRWLTWLASQMTAHQRSEFYLEDLQLDWLPKRQRAFYRGSMLLGVLVFGQLIGLVAGLVLGQLAGLGIGLTAGLGILLYGLMEEMDSAKEFSWWERLVLGLFIVLLVGLLIVLIVWLVGVLGGGLLGVLGGGLLGVLVLWIVASYFNMLSFAIQYITLPLWLWQARCTPAPWRYVAFLDDAVEQLLLRKVEDRSHFWGLSVVNFVGGLKRPRYIFRHRLLQDYFASLNVIPPYPSFRSEGNTALQTAPNGDSSV